MNYYQNSRNGYSLNNQNNDCDCNNKFYQDFSNNDYRDYYDHNSQNEYNNFNQKSCCVRRFEESVCCYPSYYNEDKQEEKQEKCYEGTFKICPKHNKEKCFNKEDKNDEQKCSHNHHNRCCCFCGLNRLFRW